MERVKSLPKMSELVTTIRNNVGLDLAYIFGIRHRV